MGAIGHFRAQTAKYRASDRIPVEVHFFFYRQNKRSFDLDNMICGSLDALQKAGILEDDTMRHVIPVIQRRPEGYGWAIDKDNPRTEIEIKSIFA